MTPYIEPTVRPPLDEVLEPLIKRLQARKSERWRDADLNYCITRLVHALYEERYVEYNAAIGMLECVKMELYRERVAPYEDKKKALNGDVP
jgi:hypothetical protein